MAKKAKNNEDASTSIELLESVYKFQLEKREIILKGVVNDEVIEKIVMQIHNFNAEDDEMEAELKNYDRTSNPIILFIHSPGGYIDDGMAVVSAIKSSRTPVHTVALGKAMSMGFMILIVGHRRYCQRYCRMMYHQLSSGTNGTLREMEEDVEQMSLLQQTLEEIVLEHTLITDEKLGESYVCKTNLYFNAEEALELGIVDEIC